LTSPLLTGQSNSELYNEIGNFVLNFAMKFPTYTSMNFENPFIRQGRSLPDNVRGEIVERWLNGSGHREIGRQLNVPKSTVANIVNKFLERRESKHRNGGCKTRTSRTDDVITYTEYCKQQQPSINAEEIQGKLVENNVCLAQNLPSKSLITRTVREDLGYSYKRLNVVSRESLSMQCEQRLID